MPIKGRQRSAVSISIIGPGRLGQALAISLARAGYTIKTLVARHAKKAEKVAASLVKTRSKVDVLPLTELSALEPSDLILITTPDDAIDGVVRRLAASHTKVTGHRVVLHTSGALSSAVLSPLTKIGFQTGSLHPLVSVSDPKSGAEALGGAFFCIEGTMPATRLARQIVRDLGGTSFAVEAEHKPLYHAAALITAGHVTALIDLAIEMLAVCGLSRKDAQKVLMPLVESAVNNLKTGTPARALTGTFARGDVATVRQHLVALSSQSEALQIYKLLGLHSLGLARQRGLDAKVVKEISKLLR